MARYQSLCNFSRSLNCYNRFSTIVNTKNQATSGFQIEQLTNRDVVKISGEGSAEFLQGLMTNDISSLTSSLYTLFLNNRGRVLFDTIIYTTEEKNSFLVECDSTGTSQFIKHLNTYKLRRKINISSLASEFNVWSIYNPTAIDENVEKNTNQFSDSPVKISNEINNNYLVVQDPRTSFMGYRLICKIGYKVPCIPQGDSYNVCRYKLGIGEGIEELLFGQSIPLEMNCDYLQGVSFSKGCYIGQELTARTFHTGVIRKRLMPLLFNTETFGIPVNSPVESALKKKSPIGKVRALKNMTGLALMRVSETIESDSLCVLGKPARSYVPVWWPLDSVQHNKILLAMYVKDQAVLASHQDHHTHNCTNVLTVNIKVER